VVVVDMATESWATEGNLARAWDFELGDLCV